MRRSRPAILTLFNALERCTVFSHYAEKNCPDPTVMLPTLQFGDGRSASGSQPSSGPYWSLMLEVSESAAHKPVDIDKVVEECIQGCLNTKLIEAGTEIVSIYHRRLEHGYPTPHVDRDGGERTANWGGVRGHAFLRIFFCYFYTYADSNLSFVAFPPSSAGGGAPAFEG